jgi:hypothetical protein
MEQLNSETVPEEEKPPIFGSWKRIYFFVLLNLFVLITLFYLLSEAFQ